MQPIPNRPSPSARTNGPAARPRVVARPRQTLSRPEVIIALRLSPSVERSLVMKETAQRVALATLIVIGSSAALALWKLKLVLALASRFHPGRGASSDIEGSRGPASAGVWTPYPLRRLGPARSRSLSGSSWCPRDRPGAERPVERRRRRSTRRRKAPRGSSTRSLRRSTSA